MSAFLEKFLRNQQETSGQERGPVHEQGQPAGEIDVKDVKAHIDKEQGESEPLETGETWQR